jgi:hypothetical protein
MSFKASLTSSSLNGLMIASIFFMQCSFFCNCPAAPHLLCHRLAHVHQHMSPTSSAHLRHCRTVTALGFSRFPVTLEL